jgi:hypothetical protein
MWWNVDIVPIFRLVKSRTIESLETRTSLSLALLAEANDVGSMIFSMIERKTIPVASWTTMNLLVF